MLNAEALKSRLKEVGSELGLGTVGIAPAAPSDHAGFVGLASNDGNKRHVGLLGCDRRWTAVRRQGVIIAWGGGNGNWGNGTRGQGDRVTRREGDMG